MLRPRLRTPWVGVGLALLIGLGLFLYFYLTAGGKVSGQADRQLAVQDIEAARLRAVDPALVKYRMTRQFPVPLRQPQALALDPQSHLHVAGDQAVVTLEADGTVRSQLELPFAPTCLTIDKAGVIYVGSRNTLAVYGPDGSLRRQWLPMSGRTWLTGLALGKDDIWVADSGNRIVLHYDLRARFLSMFGGDSPKSKAKGLIVPSPHLNVLLRPDGTLLVNNPGKLRVDTYSPTGELKSSFGKASVSIEGFCGCCNPINLALLPDGRIVTAEKGVPRVKVYRPNGVLDAVVATPADLSPQVENLPLATTSKGEIIVLDTRARLVRVFTRK